MAPPALQTYNTFTDTEVRDIYHRHQHQVVPTGNVIHKLHTHYDTQNSAPILSSVLASTMDATNANGAWNLLLRSEDSPLSQADITTANASSWTANTTITATRALTTLRSGNVSVTGNLNANILTSNALTSTTLKVTENAVLGNLQVIGDVSFGRNVTKSFNKTLLIGLGSTTEICAIDTYNGTSTIQLSIVGATGLAKLYQFAMSNDDDTGGQWQRLLPISVNDYKEVAVEIRSTGAIGADTSFRLIRTSSSLQGQTGSFTCHFNVWYDLGREFNFLDLNNQESDQPISTTIFKATALAQSNGRVGINTDNPLTTLDVRGAASVSGNVTSGNLTVTGTGNVYRLRSATGNVSALTAKTIDVENITTSGNTKSGNATVFTLADNETFNFSDKFRFYYNPGADALEIQRNIAGTWTKTATLAV